MAAVKGKELAKVYWGGRYKGKLWAMVDPQGKEAKSGSPIAALARLNKDGRDAARLIAEMEDNRLSCQFRIEQIQLENKNVAGKCAVVNKAMKDAGHLQNKSLQEYSKALRDAKAARGQIKTAGIEIEARLKDLENAKNEYEKSEVESLAKEKKVKLKNAQKERDATIASITKVLAYAKLVRGGNLVSIADAAINKIATDIVTVDYEPKLKALRKEIKVLEGRSADLDKLIFKGQVKAATLKLKAQLSDLGNKQDSLNSALKNAAEMRKLAVDALDGKKTSTRATRGLADIMKDRQKHIKYVEWARKDFAAYKATLERLMRDLTALARIYGSVDGLLKSAAKTDKSFSPDSEYGKAIVKWAAGNGLLLSNWWTHAGNEVSCCKKEEKYLNDNGARGPFAEFNKIQEQIKATRTVWRENLSAYDLKCPA